MIYIEIKLMHCALLNSSHFHKNALFSCSSARGCQCLRVFMVKLHHVNMSLNEAEVWDIQNIHIIINEIYFIIEIVLGDF